MDPTYENEKRKMLMTNLMGEMYYGITVDCVDVCKTSGKDYLENFDTVCLQNCGYNRMYMARIFSQEHTQALMNRNKRGI